MRYLIIVTCIWAFSFPLIGHFIAREVDIYFAIIMRFGLALLVFLPFTRFVNVQNALRLKLMGIGAIQIGIMYLFYYASFGYLSPSEVALFTIFTPFYVSLFYDICARRFRSFYLVSICVAVFGAFIIRSGNVDSDFLVGFLLVQGANVCFGAGQSLYKALIEQYNKSNPTLKQQDVFGYFYIGALIVGSVSFICFGDIERMPTTYTQWAILVYLGIVASGLGYFLWNKGASMADSGILAIMNNAVIPATIAVDLLLFSSNNDITKLLLGAAIIIISLLIHYRIIRFYQGTQNALT